MWGNAHEASDLEQSHPLSKLLFQLTLPESISYRDESFWTELFQKYGLLVHLDPQAGSNAVVSTACEAMCRNASTSHNLAALTLHASRILRDVHLASLDQQESSKSSESPRPLRRSVSSTSSVVTRPKRWGGSKSPSAAKLTKREASLVGKARVMCGVLNLLRILVHSVIVSTCQQHANDEQTASLSQSFDSIFGYTDESNRQQTRDSAMELLTSIMALLSVQDVPPALYDVVEMTLSLLLVLLSTQLYQPMVSSLEQIERDQELSKHILKGGLGNHYFLDKFLQAATSFNSAQPILRSLLNWISTQPPCPDGRAYKSISHHHSTLVRALVQSRGYKPDPLDGLYYEQLSSIVVASKRPVRLQHQHRQDHAISNGDIQRTSSSSTSIVTRFAPIRLMSNTSKSGGAPGSLFEAATWGVMLASSTLLLLPFRLVKLAMHTFGVLAFAKSDNSRLSEEELNTLHSLAHAGGNRPVTNDVIWLSESPIADLAGCILLLITHNFRARDSVSGISSWEPQQPQNDTNEVELSVKQAPHAQCRVYPNPFLSTLASLQDNRWEGRSAGMVVTVVEDSSEPISPLPPMRTIVPPPPPLAVHDVKVDNNSSTSSLDLSMIFNHTSSPLSMNFEKLFEAFGDTVHTELGALLLYTLLQTSNSFAASVSARSDLDTLVLPLLRTLYTSLSSEGSDMTITKRTKNVPFLKPRPFRSQSQLYVILILLLLFTQDASFGADAFRRVTMPIVPWYRERQLKDISLGSLLMLVLLRSITYNLNRLQDAFLLTNCCAVLLNLGPHMKNLHPYTAMRLASVTLSCMKKFASLVQEGKLTLDQQQDLSTVPGMYGEASRSLLQVVGQCLRNQVLQKNMHLLYALVYLQSDLHAAIQTNLFSEEEIGDLHIMVDKAHSIIREDGNALTAVQAMATLENNLKRLNLARSSSRSSHDSFQGNPDESMQNVYSSDGLNEDCAFTYQEESDPEAFFVPYIWDVTICACTASLIEWDKPKVLVFPINSVPSINGASDHAAYGAGAFSKDVADVV